MISETNMQRTIVLSKELDTKLKADADKNFSSVACVIRKILTEYYREKESKND